MKKLLNEACKDPFYYRVVLFLFSVPFTSISIILTFSLFEASVDVFVSILLLAFGIVGLLLALISFFASENFINKINDHVAHGGGEIAGVIFFICISFFALPVWCILKWLKTSKKPLISAGKKRILHVLDSQQVARLCGRR